MKKFIQGSVLSAVLAGVVAAPFAFAQPAAPSGTAAPHMTMHHEHAVKPGEHVDARLAYYKTLLKITPAQEPQWAAVANFAQKQAAKMEADMAAHRPPAPVPGQPQGQRPERPAPKNALERLDERQKRTQDMAKSMSEFLTVARPLYTSFSDEQKKKADELFSRGGFGGGPRGEHHRGAPRMH